MDKTPFALLTLKAYHEILSNTGNGQKRLLGVLSVEFQTLSNDPKVIRCYTPLIVFD